MISSIIDGILLTALAATSVCVLLMYRRLKRFDVLQTEAAAAFARSAKALENAKSALETLHENSGEMAVSLAARLNEARMMMNELDRSVDEHAAISARTEAAAPARKPPPEPAVDFVTEWEERFQGMRAAPEGSPQPARVADEITRATPNNALVPTSAARVAAINAAALEALSAGQAQSLAVSWRALADAAQRSG